MLAVNKREAIKMCVAEMRTSGDLSVRLGRIELRTKIYERKFRSDGEGME